MKTAFYFVDETYINYLKDYEVKHRGFTTVPGVVYSNRKKFLYGAVLEIDKKKYLVPVSSYTKNQRENMLIKISDHHKNAVVGSLRFNYMIPVPDKCLHLFDFKNDAESHEHRIFIEKEYRFCKSRISAIQKLAVRTYNRVISKVDDELVRNSCDFKLLEQAYDAYILK